jgi:tetratricopeptide (TPR) repeat protein
MRVGATVRVARPNHPKSTGRAVLATLQEENDSACVLIWEDPAPRPLFGQRKFVVTPNFSTKRNSPDDDEYTVDSCHIQPLFDFEYDMELTGGGDVAAGAAAALEAVEVWKDRGDQLLRVGDASAACSYYEMALSLSSSHSSTTGSQVGSTVIVKKDGFAQIAEVDCVNETDLDITYVANGDEATIRESEILLTVMNPDLQRIQERILLNVSRCLLQLAEVDKTDLDRPSRYRSSAVLASTLALTLATFHDEQQQRQEAAITTTGVKFGKTYQTALLLRSQAQAQRGKWSHAIADVKQLLKIQPNHKEGCKLLQQIEQQKARRKLVDKKLAKQMCQWVNQAATATTTATPTTSTNLSNESPVSRLRDESTTMTNKDPNMSLNSPTHTSFSSLFMLWWKWVVLPIMLAWILQHYFMKTTASP